jgi:hypothetical protein
MHAMIFSCNFITIFNAAFKWIVFAFYSYFYFIDALGQLKTVSYNSKDILRLGNSSSSSMSN